MDDRSSLYRILRDQRLLLVCKDPIDDSKEVAKIAAVSEVDVGLMITPETSASLGCLKLKIPFFTEEQLGAAFHYGPIGIDIILAFCEQVEHALMLTVPPSFVCIRCSRQVGVLGNAVLLIGAFLVLKQGIPAADVLQHLLMPVTDEGHMPELRFPLPWDAMPVYSRDSLTIHDCIFGLEAAVANDWLDCRGKNSKTSLAYDAVPIFKIAVQDSEQLSLEGDKIKRTEDPNGKEHDTPCGWIRDEQGGPSQLQLGQWGIPVTFWIAADPVTTVLNPSVRPDMPPTEESLDEWSPPLSTTSNQEWDRQTSGSSSITTFNRRVSPGSTCSAGSAASHDPNQEWLSRSAAYRRHKIKRADKKSCIDKLSRFPAVDRDLQRPADLPAFAKWLSRDIHCRLMVRSNFPHERNLPGGSYTDFFTRWGTPQLDVPFLDGNAPSAEVVTKLVAEVTALLQQLSPASGHIDFNPKQLASSDHSVMIHCKSGLGRSMCLLGALAIALIPGLSSSAFFGWARLARPGCIQTAIQERFLRSLDEDEDTRKSNCCCFSFRN